MPGARARAPFPAARLLQSVLPWLAAAVPLVFSTLTHDVFELPAAFAAALVCALAAVLALCGGELGRLRTAVDVPLAVFLAVLLVSAGLSADVRLSVFGSYPNPLWGLFGMAGCVAGLGAGCLLAGAAERDRLRRALLLCSIPASLYALAQHAGWEPFLPGLRMFDEGRPASTLGSPVFLGLYLCAMVPLGLEESSCAGRAAWPGRAALALALAALAACAARAAWLGACVGAAAWAFLRHYFRLMDGRFFPPPAAREDGSVLRMTRRRGRLLFAACVAGIAALLFWTVSFRRAQLAVSDAERWGMWKIACRQFAQTPWWGAGPDTFTLSYRRWRAAPFAGITHYGWAQEQAHNDILQVLSTLGLAGLLAYAWLHWAAARRVLRSLPLGSAHAATAVAALCGVWAAVKFNTASYAALWPACLLAGTLLREEPAAREACARRFFPGLWLLCSAAFLAFCARAVAADRACLLGVRARRAGAMREAAVRLEQALSRRPEVLDYRFRLASMLWDAAEGLAPGPRAALLERAAQVAWQGVRLHPSHGEAYFLLGRSELERLSDGREDRREAALRAFEAAAECDPADERVRAALGSIRRMVPAGPRRTAKQAGIAGGRGRGFARKR